jgi:DNA replication protein DnaC
MNVNIETHREPVYAGCLIPTARGGNVAASAADTKTTKVNSVMSARASRRADRRKCRLEVCQRRFVLIGDSGTGKSHLLIGLGTAAAMAGFRVRYVLAAKLVNELVEAADDKTLTKTIARYGRVDLLCIDELGYMELDRRGAELLFQVLTEREEKNSVAIASNESFSGWTKTFTDPRLCAAIVDRLTFNGTIIETGTKSYRMAHTKARQQKAAIAAKP